MSTVGLGKYEPLVNEAEDSLDDRKNRAFQFNKPKRITWDHIQNLDQFFTDIYRYHQEGGFNVLVLAQLLWIIKFTFVVFLAIELSVCTRWEYLANNSLPVYNWADVFQPPLVCWASLPFGAALLVVGAVLTLLVQFVCVGIRLGRYWQIRRFCTNVLDLPTTDTGLSDLTWSEVQQRLIESQRDFQLSVFKLNLNELDIYNRILRHTNYLIAMINQDILPIKFRIPSVSMPPYIYFPDGYIFNLKLLLFWTPWSPFHNYWQLRADYKWVTKRHELASELATRIRVLGALNLALSPFIFFGQLLAFACANAERFRYQPAILFGRRWSNYAKFYLRHFNELHHEYAVRVSQAYVPASRYLDSFVSRTLTVLVESGVFIFGGASVAFFMAGLIREQMMHLPGYLAILVGGGLLARACLTLIPDEHMVHCPRNLLITTLMRIHYMPEHWKDNAGTYQVRSEFAQLFQYRLVGLLEELLSPIITPFLLLFVLPNHTLEIVDFLRNYTVEVPGVGDVCSFAQLDIRRHGDPCYHPDLSEIEGESKHPANLSPSETDPNDNHISDPTDLKIDSDRVRLPSAHQVESFYQDSAALGKTELSLMHFHLTNPTWRLPPDGLAFLKSVRTQALLDFQQQERRLRSQLQQGTGQAPSAGNAAISSTMFSSLYKAPSSNVTSVYQKLATNSSGLEINQNSKLKNVSHLPGPVCLPENTLGVVGAMIESMKSSMSRSMHQSDPGMSRTQVSTGQRIVTCTGDVNVPESSCTIHQPSLSVTSNVLPSAKVDNGMIGSNISPAVFNYSMLDGPTPVMMSLMAASTVYSPDGLGFPFYQPYNSQTEEGLSQHFGINNSLMNGHQSTLTDVLTTDMSVSALYLHELFHRRLQQRRSQHIRSSYNSQGPMVGSTPGVSHRNHDVDLNSAAPNIGVYTISNLASPYQMPYTSFAPSTSYQQLLYRQSVDQLVTERTNLSSRVPNFSYGAVGNEPGIIRTSSTGRNRHHIPQFVEVTEEDEAISTPPYHRDPTFPAFGTTELDSHLRRHPSGQSAATVGGIVTLSGSPSVRSVPQPGETRNIDTAGHNTLDSDNATGPVWPDLPPTNC